MADITKRLFLRHLRTAPTVHVRHLNKGRITHEGTGLSYWFRPLAAAISELPVDDRELPLLFHARTRDFQDVTVQAAVTFRIADPEVAATRVDFSIDPDTGRWQANPLEQLAGLLTQSAQQHALEVLAAMELATALADGVGAVRDGVAVGLRTDERLAATGIEVVGVRVVALRAEPEVERALQTPTREQVQQDADRATYERRATAVHQERAIAENELANQIELAKREEELVGQRGQNRRREAETQAEAGRIDTQATAERTQTLAEAEAEAARVVGMARAEVEVAELDAYRELDTATVMALAIKELAGNLPEIGTLNLTPDLLTPILTRLAGGVVGGGGGQ